LRENGEHGPLPLEPQRSGLHRHFCCQKNCPRFRRSAGKPSPYEDRRRGHQIRALRRSSSNAPALVAPAYADIDTVGRALATHARHLTPSSLP
jgi:hypothetical protein